VKLEKQMDKYLKELESKEAEILNFLFSNFLNDNNITFDGNKVLDHLNLNENELEIIIEKFLNDSPLVFKIVETGEVEVNALLVETNDKTYNAKRIEKIHEKVYI